MAVGAPTVRNLYTGTTTGNLYVDRRQFYLTPAQFSELFPNVSPFLTFTMKANFRSGLQDPVFKLFEHKAPWERQYMTTTSAVTVAAGSTGTSAESNAITFDAAYGVPASGTTPTISEALANTIWEVWDSTGVTLRGVCMLTEDSSATTAKFKNLGKTAFTTVSGDLFVLITNAQGENAVAPEAWSSELTTVWNQCQIFRTPIEISGTLAQASLRGANKELARLRTDKMMEHKIHMEKAFLFGSSLLGTNLDASSDTFSDLDKTTGLDDKLVRSTVGIVRAIQLYGATTGQYRSNITIVGAGATYDDIVDEMEIVFQYVPTSGVKPAFVGSSNLGYWSKRAMDKNSGWVINQNSAEKNIAGQKVRTLVTPHGDLDLMLTHSFKYEHKNQMLIVDPRNLEYVQYRPSAFKTNIKTDDGYDGIKDEYFSDAGLGVTNIKAHQLITIT